MTSMFKTRHYKAIAYEIGISKTRQDLIQNLIAMFARDNINFNLLKFKKAACID